VSGRPVLSRIHSRKDNQEVSTNGQHRHIRLLHLQALSGGFLCQLFLQPNKPTARPESAHHHARSPLTPESYSSWVWVQAPFPGNFQVAPMKLTVQPSLLFSFRASSQNSYRKKNSQVFPVPALLSSCPFGPFSPVPPMSQLGQSEKGNGLVSP